MKSTTRHNPLNLPAVATQQRIFGHHIYTPTSITPNSNWHRSITLVNDITISSPHTSNKSKRKLFTLRRGLLPQATSPVTTQTACYKYQTQGKTWTLTHTYSYLLIAVALEVMLTQHKRDANYHPRKKGNQTRQISLFEDIG